MVTSTAVYVSFSHHFMTWYYTDELLIFLCYLDLFLHSFDSVPCFSRRNFGYVFKLSLWQLQFLFPLTDFLLCFSMSFFGSSALVHMWLM